MEMKYNHTAETDQTLGNQETLFPTPETEPKHQAIEDNVMSDDEMDAKSFNSEPYIYGSDLENLIAELDDDLSYGEWQTVTKKKRFNIKRGKPKPFFLYTTFQTSITKKQNSTIAK